MNGLLDCPLSNLPFAYGVAPSFRLLGTGEEQ
jgi:hypothetical protein